MKIKTSAIFLTISVLLISCSPKHIILHDFVFDEQSLPNGCKLVKPNENEPLPLNIPNNPYISSDTSFTNLARFLLKTDQLNSSIEEALFSVYQCNNEIGINGIAFKTYEDAQKCEEILNNTIDDTLRFSVIRNKNIVIHLWRDDVTDSCYYDFQKLIRDKLK